MESLRVKHSVAQVRQATQNLPRGIDNAYNEAIDRIRGQDEENVTLAFAVLSWIVLARRPLCVTELRFAVAMAAGMDPHTTGLDSDDAIMETILTSYCAGLVVIDEMTKIVRLVRKSPMVLAQASSPLMLTNGCL
jgi:hypothetical protein